MFIIVLSLVHALRYDPMADSSAKNTVVMSNGDLVWGQPGTYGGMLDRSPCGTGMSPSPPPPCRRSLSSRWCSVCTMYNDMYCFKGNMWCDYMRCDMGQGPVP